MDIGISLISFAICLGIVIFIAKVVFKGTVSVLGFLINAAIGALALLVLDAFGYGVPITWLTAGIVGLLGVPGVVVICVLKYVFNLI